MRPKCFHVNTPMRMKDQLLYNVGEEVVYSNSDHVEKGIIERIENKNDYNVPEYVVKFKDNRIVKASADIL